jgi:hypothetical protein
MSCVAHRLLALFIVAVGLLTFFWPFVTTDPPVGGISRWSCLTIVEQMYKGALPTPACERCGEPSARVLLALPFTVLLDYLFMIAAATAACSGRSARLLMGIALLGAYSCLRSWGVGTRLAFEGKFFGFRQGHVHYSGLLAAHLVVLLALFLVAQDVLDESGRSR